MHLPSFGKLIQINWNLWGYSLTLLLGMSLFRLFSSEREFSGLFFSSPIRFVRVLSNLVLIMTARHSTLNNIFHLGITWVTIKLSQHLIRGRLRDATFLAFFSLSKGIIRLFPLIFFLSCLLDKSYTYQDSAQFSTLKIFSFSNCMIMS